MCGDPVRPGTAGNVKVTLVGDVTGDGVCDCVMGKEGTCLDDGVLLAGVMGDGGSV